MASYPRDQDFRSSESSVQPNSSLQYSSPPRSAIEIPVEVTSGHSQYPYFVQHPEKHLPHRQWSDSLVQEDLYPYFKIHLICYNILAQRLLWENQRLYQQCFNQHLNWNRRRERLYKELFRQNPDIICLQEMQADHYQYDFRPTMIAYGYESIYTKRSGEKCDGCCILYRIDRFKLVASQAVTFYRQGIPILDRDNCGLIALFQPLTRHASCEDLFCVATTHLLFSPSRGDIKLAQLQYFLAEIDRFTRRETHPDSQYPLILCGDFNAQLQSPLYQFLINGYLKYDGYRCAEISGQTSPSTTKSRPLYSLPSNELLPSDFVTADCRFPTPPTDLNRESSTGVLRHCQPLVSVYDPTDFSRVTSHVNHESNLVDHIFFTKPAEDSSGLHCLSRYELYRRDQLLDVHMPNHQFPSDHFLLAAKFAFKLRRGKNTR